MDIAGASSASLNEGAAGQLRNAVEQCLGDAQKFLEELIAFPSLPGQEHEAMLFLEAAFSGLRWAVARVPLDDKLRADPDYSSPLPDIRYQGRFNLRIRRPGQGGGRSLVFNTHVDVVPPSEGMHDAWTAKVLDGKVFGRGTCDAKGQIATLYLLACVLNKLQIPTRGDLILHLVNEEECGGNGTLAMIRHGERADGCVVLEPSNSRLYTSVRGAVWFCLACMGEAGHSGQPGQTRSALLMARDAMAAFEKYHAELLANSRGFELFDGHPNPMPLTFGRLVAGNWPASAPSRAVLEGVLGFLPNKTKEQVCEEMQRALATARDGSLADGSQLAFTYRHDSSVLSPAHPLPQTLLQAGRAAGRPLTVSGMTASCDAWFYNNQLRIPTVVYGPGSLSVAHSRHEHIAMADIAQAAEVLARLVAAWCG